MTVSLITGSSTGIGEATALRLARAGHHTFASMRNPDAGQALLDTAEAEGLKLEVIQLDVTDPASCERAVDTVVERGGAIDVLVNNAGIGGGRFIEETTDEDWQRIFDTNLFGLVRMTRLVLPHMREQGSGSIVNISSIAGRAAITPQAIYSATKWAVEATSEILAQEVNPLGIQVVVIEPGIVLTPIFGKGDPDYAPSPQYAHLFQRFMQMFGAALPHASSAGGIADSIAEAVESGKPFQRIVDGFAGKEFVAMRESMTDDEWTAYGRKMSNAEANDFFRPALGVDLYTDQTGDE